MVPVVLALGTWLGYVQASESCAQVVDVNLSSCPCDAAKFAVTLGDNIELESKTVRLGVVYLTISWRIQYMV